MFFLNSKSLFVGDSRVRKIENGGCKDSSNIQRRVSNDFSPYLNACELFSGILMSFDNGIRVVYYYRNFSTKNVMRCTVGRLVFISNIIFNLTIHPLPLNFNTSIGLMKIRC